MCVGKWRNLALAKWQPVDGINKNYFHDGARGLQERGMSRYSFSLQEKCDAGHIRL